MDHSCKGCGQVYSHSSGQIVRREDYWVCVACFSQVDGLRQDRRVGSAGSGNIQQKLLAIRKRIRDEKNAKASTPMEKKVKPISTEVVSLVGEPILEEEEELFV